MKKLKKIYKVLYVILFIVVTFSCNKSPDLRMPDIIDGFLPDMEADLITGSPVIDLDNLENVVFVIEFNVNEQYTKTDAQQFDLAVNYKADPNSAGISAVVKTNIELGQVTVTFPEVRDALGISDDELEIGHQFIFGVDVTLDNGLKLPAFSLGENAYSDDVHNIPGSSPYAVYTVACQVIAPFVGDYQIEFVSGSNDGIGSPNYPIVPIGDIVTVSALTHTTRTFRFNYYNFTMANFTFDMVCGDIIVPKTGSGIGCGGTLAWVGADTPSTYDPTDDSEIVISIVDNIDADCGAAPTALTFRLVKQ